MMLQPVKNQFQPPPARNVSVAKAAEETKGVNEDDEPLQESIDSVKQDIAMERPTGSVPVARGIAPCWHGDGCRWHKRSLCFFGHSSAPSQVRGQTAEVVKMIHQEWFETLEQKLVEEIATERDLRSREAGDFWQTLLHHDVGGIAKNVLFAVPNVMCQEQVDMAS